MSPFNQPRNIRHHKAALFLRFADRNYAEIKLQSGKRIISNLRPRRRDTRNQRGLADVGKTDQPHISQQLKFQPEDAFFAGPTLFVLTRRLVRGRSKARIPPPTAPAAGNHDAFIRAGKIVHLLARFRVIHNRSHRHLQQNVFALAPLAVRTLAVTSALRLVLRIESEVNQSVVALARFHNDVPAITTIAAGWPTPRNILLPPESQTAISAIPSLHPNCGFINKHKSLGRAPLVVGPKTKKPQPEGEADAMWRGRPRPRSSIETLLHSDRLNHDVLSQLASILEHDPARDLGK